MSKSILYNWQKFVDGQALTEISDDQDLLLEMKQSVISYLSDEIETAESGIDQTMPFNDIFGEPEKGNPKTRMIIPYGNKDISIMKNLMLDIWDKLFKQYNSNPNIGYVRHILWESRRSKVQQAKKPQGWKEGEPIPTVEKEVCSPYVVVGYTTKQTGPEVIKTVEFSFGKMLQKYFPQGMVWWQGDKSKGISGKQSFFTNNPETMDQIVHDVKYGDENEIRAERENSGGSIVLLSRHPIDVVRMSDFELLSYSCHAQGGQYFECAVQEAKRSAGGGGVLFLIKEEEFKKKFPDGVIPQTGEIFNDEQRDIRNGLRVEPTSRLRLRKVVSDEMEFAVPDSKMYGMNPEAFRKETQNYFASTQIEKFVDPKTKEIKIPTNLGRLGGSYEDSGEYNIGTNFISLMDTALRQAGLTNEQISANTEYTSFKQTLKRSSIEWLGSYSEEEEISSEFSGDEGSARCREQKQDIDELLYRENAKVISGEGNYINYSILDDYCEDGTTYVDLIASVTVRFPASLLKDGVDENDILDKLYDVSWTDIEYTGEFSIEYPDLSFNQDRTSVYVGDSMVDINFSYEETNIDQLTVIRRIEDFKNFVGGVSYEDYVNDVIIMLGEKNLLKKSHNLSEQNIEILDELDKQIEGVFEIESKKKTSRKYVMTHLLTRLPSSKMSFEFLNMPERIKSIQQAFPAAFKQKFNKIAYDKYLGTIRQVPLFDELVEEPRIIAPKLYDVALVISKEKRELSKDSMYLAAINFYIDINGTLEESEFLSSVAFMYTILKDPSMIEDTAYEVLMSLINPYLAERKKPTSNKLIKEGWIKKR